MSFAASFNRLAEAELREAAHYYEAEAPGLGRRFLPGVESALAEVLDHPLVGSPLRGDVRRKSVGRFPYHNVVPRGWRRGSHPRHHAQAPAAIVLGRTRLNEVIVDILLANPRGFCAGVDRAIAIVERALESYGAPIYVRHEVVHNRYVVDKLRADGAVFVEELHEVPDGATVIFSAHGVSQAVREEAGQRQLKVFDATCPLVTKVHMEVARLGRIGRSVVLIGHAGHPEVEGTMGQWNTANSGEILLVESLESVARLAPKFPHALSYVTQTTLSVDDTKAIIEALRAKFPDIEGPRKDDICYATQNRQDAVRRLADAVDLMLVVGSINSSNSNRLRELAEKQGVRSFLIDGAEHIERRWLDGVKRIGLTAGASAPDKLVRDVITRLQSWGAGNVRELDGEPENITFALPKELRLPGGAGSASF
jgi:4-hydroxy-3-methylbut-2-enyl diphosphate reductase